jgi:hypothetical protein
MTSSHPSFAKRLSQFLRAPFRRDPAPTVEHERHGVVKPESLTADIIKDFISQSKRLPADLHLMMQFIDVKSAGGYMDDSKYMVSLLSSCSLTNHNSLKILFSSSLLFLRIILKSLLLVR